ncbi:MAG TPA: hypothetical protein VFO10_12840 [Oligoflexus sp.]|uniref:hypothetical protein n=1 Tax=Oligoflexus sp. TaxID=1971216 RepID=UPI002D80CE53|nr:hypothetical protein [Oligoflexus sp.]HET9238138.1 hypothetical protein [Oligoflexus sp.]
MKRIVGIAFFIALSANVASGAGSVGGFAGMYVSVSGKLTERIVILREGSTSDSTHIAYPIPPDDFARLRNVADSWQFISAKGENGTRTYRVNSGDQYNEVELVDPRAVMRNGRSQ